jgi:hypothetical protein
MIKLDAPGMLKAVSTRLLEDIDNYCVTNYDGGHRNHLGVSLIGHECKRYLWFIFRWCKHEVTTARQQRLFNRGHREEARFLEWLRGVGCIVSDVTEDGKQHRVSDCNEHFGGSLDGMGFLPPSYDIPEKVLFEFKTNGTGKGFNDLTTKGMILAKEQHYAQTSTYGFKEDLKYCVYCNINKNDDSLHLEIVELNHKLGEHMIIKAEQIIASQSAPPRLSDNPTMYKCGYCGMKGICHNNDPIEINCRSCTNSFPGENGKWACNKFSVHIPKEYIYEGCMQWSKIY